MLFRSYKKKMQYRLTRAHVLLKAEEFITVCIITSAATGFLLFFITGRVQTGKGIAFAIIGCITGWLIPGIILSSKTKRRIKNLNDQLCDAIVLISNSLKAGYSFFQAIDIVSKEMEGPVSEEFTQLLKEINLGLPTEVALESLAKRVDSDDLELVLTAVLIQRQVGGNLAEVLDNISSTIRERIRIKGEVRTVTAQGRMSGLIISILPPALGLIIYLIDPEHMSLLFTTGIGIAILVFSIFSELLGIYFISKIARIEM